MEHPQVVIVDYEMGNLFSLVKVIKYLGGIPLISKQPSDILSAERLILPGVGAFGDGIENLKRRGLIEPIKEFARTGKALLGICLGMQLFMSESEEFGLYAGLDLVPGKVKKLNSPQPAGQLYKIPHVGWNRLLFPSSPEDPREGSLLQKNKSWEGTILQNTSQGAFVYFVHSFVAVPNSASVIMAETVYTNIRFCSVLRQGNLFGCQFHPEISGETGSQILKEFLYSFYN
jgi:glutamine amidotransferase